MPQAGEIKSASQIGRNSTHRFIWVICPICGFGRWRCLYHVSHSPKHTGYCLHCSSKLNVAKNKGVQNGEKNSNWKGGIRIDRNGYVQIWVSAQSKFASMSSKRNEIKEHRLVMAKYLGRCLERWEHVHHRNGIKSDNQIENLMLVDNKAHPKGYMDGYQQGWKDAMEFETMLLRPDKTLDMQGRVGQH